MSWESPQKRKFFGRRIGYVFGGFIGFLFIAMWGSGMVFSDNTSPSFFADMGEAFSSTFLKQETFRGEFDFSEKRIVQESHKTDSVCGFDSVEKPARTSVVFNEIAWMGTKDAYADEWIEIKNRSDRDIDISHWKIIDRGGDISFSFPKESILKNGALLVLQKGKEKEMFSGSLKNTDEFIRLFDNECFLMDEAGGKTWLAGDNITKQTMERDRKGFGWHTSTLPGGTPGDENSNYQYPISKNTETKKEKDSKNKQPEIQSSVRLDVSSTSVLISEGYVDIIEVVAGKEGNTSYEFIKLHNPSGNIIELTGWTIKKRSSTGNETTLVSSVRLEGKIIPSKGYFLLASEGGYSGSPTPDVWWPKSYTLAEKGNAVILYNANGDNIKEFSW